MCDRAAEAVRSGWPGIEYGGVGHTDGEHDRVERHRVEQVDQRFEEGGAAVVGERQKVRVRLEGSPRRGAGVEGISHR